jgi:hypothetical protein
MLYYSGDEGQRWLASATVGTRLSHATDLLVGLGYRKSLSGVNIGRTLMRGEIELHFRSRRDWAPLIRYETDIAGRDIRQGSSVVIGISRRY